jgi:anion-transporting  ArsA/GET3 family ATPase
MARQQPGTERCRLVVVTGKGGVGKTTVTAAAGLALAGGGRDTVAAELAGQSRIPALLGGASSGRPGAEAEIAPGLWTTTIDPEGALAEWAGQIVRPRAVLELAIRSRAFSGFVSAAPGASELISVTKACELSSPSRWAPGAPSHEVAVLDAPASGHGMGLLRSPRTYAEIARVGPIATQAREVDELLRDPERCLIVVVAIPEETPVNEAGELAGLLEEGLGRGPSLVVMNSVLEGGLSESEAELARGSSGAPAAILAADRRLDLARRQEVQLERLRSLSPAPVLTLPNLGPAGATPDGVELLADLIAPALAAG